MGRTVISFLLLNFLIAPLLALLIALVFGSVLAYAEEWPVWGKDGGFYYVLTNVAAVQPVGSQTNTEGKMGIVVDVLVSTVCLVFASTVIGCSGMLAFVSNLPDKLRLTTPARGIFALLVFIPAATLAACTVIGAVLAWVEDISFGTCFQFVVQSVCGLGNPLTPWVPQGTSSIIAVATLGVAAQGLVGLIIGVASGITPLVATVQRFDRLIHKGPGSQLPVLPAERQPLDSTNAAVDLDSMPANEVLAYARRLQSGLRAAETFDASRPKATPRTPPMPTALSGTPDELGLAGGVAAQPKAESF